MPVEAEFDRIVRVIEDAIARGEFKPDRSGRRRLPTQSAMANCFGVSPSTVQTALRILEARGVIIRYQGKPAEVASSPSEGEGGASTVRPHEA